jgi:hypothetical protein
VCVWAGTRKAVEEWVRAQLMMSPSLCSQASSGLRICVFQSLSGALSCFHPVAVLQVRQHPENAPAWRLLGTVHAENDDDRQVSPLVGCFSS